MIPVVIFCTQTSLFAQTLAGTKIEARADWQARLDYNEEQYSSTATVSLDVQALPSLTVSGQGGSSVRVGGVYTLLVCNQGNTPLSGGLTAGSPSSPDYSITFQPPRIALAPGQCTNVAVSISGPSPGTKTSQSFTVGYRDDQYGDLAPQRFTVELLPSIETTLQLSAGAKDATAQLGVFGWGAGDRLQLRFASSPTSAPYQFANAQVVSDCGAGVVFDSSGTAQITNQTGSNRCTIQIVIPLDGVSFPSGAVVELQAAVTTPDGAGRTATALWVNRTRRRVLDARTLLPLAGASITVSSGERRLTQAQSDQTGAWSIPLDQLLTSVGQASATLLVEIRAARHNPVSVEISFQPGAVGYRLTGARLLSGQAALPLVDFAYSELTFDALLMPLYAPVELRKRPLQTAPRLLMGATEAGFTSGSPTVERGGAISYEIEVISNDYSGQLIVRDQLPVGMRLLRAGVASSTQPDFFLELTPGQSRVIRYTTVVGADAPLGWAVNRAQAFDPQGRQLSAPAVASVQITTGLYADDLVAVGRVFYDLDGDGRYSPQRDLPAGTTRIVASNGRVALTDKQGKFHFAALPQSPFSLIVDIPGCREQERPIKGCQQMVLPLTSRGGGVFVIDFPLPAALARDAVLHARGDLPVATPVPDGLVPPIQTVQGGTLPGSGASFPQIPQPGRPVGLRTPSPKRSLWRKLQAFFGVKSNPSPTPSSLSPAPVTQTPVTQTASTAASQAAIPTHANSQAAVSTHAKRTGSWLALAGMDGSLVKLEGQPPSTRVKREEHQPSAAVEHGEQLPSTAVKHEGQSSTTVIKREKQLPSTAAKGEEQPSPATTVVESAGQRAGGDASKVLPTGGVANKIVSVKDNSAEEAREASAQSIVQSRDAGDVSVKDIAVKDVDVKDVNVKDVNVKDVDVKDIVFRTGVVGAKEGGGDPETAGDSADIVVPAFIVETGAGEQLEWVRVDDREVGLEQVGRTERYPDGRVRRYYYLGLSAGPHELVYSVRVASGQAQQRQRRIHVRGDAQRVAARLVGDRLELRFADAWGQPARDRQARIELRGAVSGCAGSDRITVEGGQGVIPCVRLLSERGEVVIHREANTPLTAGFSEERTTAFGWGELLVRRSGPSLSGGVYLEGVSLARAARLLRRIFSGSNSATNAPSNSQAVNKALLKSEEENENKEERDGLQGAANVQTSCVGCVETGEQDGAQSNAPAEGARPMRGFSGKLDRVRIDFVGDLRERLLDGRTIPFAARGGFVAANSVLSGSVGATGFASGSGVSGGAFSRYREFADASVEALVAASTWRWWGRVRLGDHSRLSFGYIQPDGDVGFGGSGAFGGAGFNVAAGASGYGAAGNANSLLTWARTLAGGRFSGEYKPFGRLLQIDVSAGYSYGREQVIERFTPASVLRLSRRDIVLGTEIVVVEHRSRLSPQQVVRRETLARAVDYDLDPASGTILLKRYVPLVDDEGDPLLVAVSYEAGFECGSQILAFGRAVLGITDKNRLTFSFGGSETGARAFSLGYSGSPFKGGTLSGEVAATRGGDLQLTEGLHFGARLAATQDVTLSKRRISFELRGQFAGFGFSDPFGFNALSTQTTTDLTGRASTSLAGGRLQIGWRYTTSQVLAGANSDGYALVAPRRQASVDASFGRDWSRFGFEVGLRATDITEGSPQLSRLRLSAGALSFSSFAGLVPQGMTSEQSVNSGYRARSLAGRFLFRYRPSQGLQIEFVREQPLWLSGERDFATVAASEVRVSLTRQRVELSGRLRYIDSTRFRTPYSVATVGGNILSVWTQPGRLEGSFSFGYRRGAYALRVQGSRAGSLSTTSVGGERLFTWRTARVVLGIEATRVFQPTHTAQSSARFSSAPQNSPSVSQPVSQPGSPQVSPPSVNQFFTRTIPRFYLEAGTPRASVRIDIARYGRTFSFSLTPRGVNSAARINFAATNSFGSRQLISTIDLAHRSPRLVALSRVDLRRQNGFGQGATLLGASLDVAVAQPIARALQPALRIVFSRLDAAQQYVSPVIFEGGTTPTTLSGQASNQAFFTPQSFGFSSGFAASTSDPRAQQALSAPLSTGFVGTNRSPGLDHSSTVRVTTALLAPRVDLLLGGGFDLRSEARAFWQNSLWSGGGAVEFGRRFGAVRLAAGYAHSSRALADSVTPGAARGFYFRVDASSEILTWLKRK